MEHKTLQYTAGAIKKKFLHFALLLFSFTVTSRISITTVTITSISTPGTFVAFAIQRGGRFQLTGMYVSSVLHSFRQDGCVSHWQFGSHLPGYSTPCGLKVLGVGQRGAMIFALLQRRKAFLHKIHCAFLLVHWLNLAEVPRYPGKCPFCTAEAQTPTLNLKIDVTNWGGVTFRQLHLGRLLANVPGVLIRNVTVRTYKIITDASKITDLDPMWYCKLPAKPLCVRISVLLSSKW